jgi:hypothetical protein
LIDVYAGRLDGGRVFAADPREGIGDYRCACGQEYRLLVTASRIRIWPRNGASSFSSTDVAGDGCIRCSALLPVR